MKKLLLLAIASTFSVGIWADTTIFQCETTNKKNVLVQMNKNRVSYKFGRNLSKPEIAFSVPKNEASTYQWPGGGSIYYDVDVPNGETVYTVYSSIDRMSREYDSESGIVVTQNGKELARILCNNNLKRYKNNLEDVDLPSSY